MKQKSIILRNKLRSSALDPFAGPSSVPTTRALAAPDLQLNVDELERRDLSVLHHDAQVVAVAPVMPMKLILPLDGGEPVAAAPGTTWGVEAVGAHTSPFTGDGIVVAVLDTGIDAAHPAFTGVQIVERDFTGEGNGDQNGHGTHCVGTIFGRDLNGLRIGVASGVKKALIGKVLGNEGGGSDQVHHAILWARENGANVISMSLGIDFPGFVKSLEEAGFPTELATSRALEAYRANVQLFERLAALLKVQGFFQATVIVAAAGNESQRAVDPDFEIAVSPPAVSEGIISVAALGQADAGLTVAPFSNTGANISGPGVNVVSAKVGGGTRVLSGTSMATPHVAGVAALWAEKLQKSGRLDILGLIARVLGTATTTPLAAGFDPFDIGEGLVQAPQ
jgi:subtilisin family serine protease